MKTAWKPKKEKFITPEYTDRVCRMDFEYKLEEKVVNYYFKGTACTEK